MRKLLAVLLAAIMLVGVLAALPVGAETEAPKRFDDTTSADTPTLLITEVLINSKTGNANLDDQMVEGDVATWISPDAFDYIEIYNAGSDPVDLYDYSIVRANGSQFFDKSEESETVGQFTHKIHLDKTTIQAHPDSTGAKFGSYDAFQNPEDATLMPGEFAIIWFYGEGTTKLTDELKATVGKAEFVKNYGMPEDTMVIAVPGKTSNGTSFDLAPNYVYALVEDDFDIAKYVVSNPWTEDAMLTENGKKIVCMAEYILRNAVGIYSDANMDDMSSFYVPANCKPEVLNTVNKQTVAEGEYQELNDYVEAEFTKTYRGSANMSYVEAPTPGTMPAWQWAYVDPVGETKTVGGVNYTHGLQALSNVAAAGNAYEATMKALVADWETNTAIKNADGKLDVTVTDGKVAWSTNSVGTLITEKANVVTGEGNNDEVKIDYTKNFVSRDELEKRHNMQQKPTTGEEGLPIWALILIIVGGVVLVAGIAVVVIIIIKKKNKPVAADDVAAEGEIQVVDETEANEAPADKNKE